MSALLKAALLKAALKSLCAVFSCRTLGPVSDPRLFLREPPCSRCEGTRGSARGSQGFTAHRLAQAGSDTSELHLVFLLKHRLVGSVAGAQVLLCSLVPVCSQGSEGQSFKCKWFESGKPGGRARVILQIISLSHPCPATKGWDCALCCVSSVPEGADLGAWFPARICCWQHELII